MHLTSLAFVAATTLAFVLLAEDASADPFGQALPESQPPPAPEPAPEPPRTSAPEPPRHAGRHLVGKVDGGAFYRSIFEIPVVGGEGSLSLGSAPEVDTGSAQAWFRMRYAFGRTEHGLAVHVPRAGAEIQWSEGRLRPSFGMDVLWLAIVRSGRGLVQHWGIGLSAAIAIDVVVTNAGRGALFVAPHVDLDLFPHKLVPRTFSYSGALGVGYRF